MASKKPPKEDDIPEWDKLKSQVYTIVASLNDPINSRQLRDDIRLVLLF